MSRGPSPQVREARLLLDRTPHLPHPSEFSPAELTMLKDTLEALRARAATVKLTPEENGVARTLLSVFSAYGALRPHAPAPSR